MLRRLLIAVVLSMLASCASSLRYTTDFPLSNQFLRSRDGSFTARIPQGWSSTMDDSLAPTLAAWLVRNDLSATLTVKELLLDRLSAQQVEHEGLKLLASISMGFIERSTNADGTVQVNEFEMRGKKFCAFEVTDGGMVKRIVVFTTRGKFYECEAFALKGRWTGDETKRLFTAQQTFLSSLLF